jgi:hypothetical protein
VVEADKVNVCPAQTGLLEDAIGAEGTGLTLIVTELVLLHPVAVTVSVRVYIVVLPGLTDGLALVDVKPEGDEIQL